MRQSTLATLACYTTAILWGSAFVGIRIGLTEFSPGVLALLRYLVASIVMIFIYVRIPNKRIPSKKELPFIMLLGVLGIGIYNITLNIGEMTVSAGVAGFIASQIPVVTIVLSMITLKERLTKTGWAGLACSFIGVALIAIGEDSFTRIDHGFWFVVIAACSAGTYFGLQKLVLGRFNALEMTAIVIWSGTCAMLGYVHPMIHEVMHASIKGVLSVLYLGVFPATLAYACWSYGMKHKEACKAASYLYWMPVTAVVLGWLVLGEVPVMLSLIGGLLALFGSKLIRS